MPNDFPLPLNSRGCDTDGGNSGIWECSCQNLHKTTLLAVKTEHTELIHLFLDLARLSLARGCHYLWSRLWIKLLKSPGNQRKKREAHNCSTCLRIIISLWHQSRLHVYEPSVNKDCKQLICRTSNGANLPKWKQNVVQIASHRQTPHFIWRCL